MTATKPATASEAGNPLPAVETKTGLRKVGPVVLFSMLGGLAVSLLLVLIVFAGGAEPQITGSALVGFALGWLALAVLSSRLTQQPQRWAYVPAAYMGVVGLAFLLFNPGDRLITSFGWVWPVLLAVITIWITSESRQHLRSRTRQWVMYPIFAALALAALGGTYAQVKGTFDRSHLSMAGKLIDVGGYRLHITCIGSGSPTVVVEPGLGEPASAMTGWITPKIAQKTRVCSYDRAGRGWSDASPTPLDGVQTAAALHMLLHRAHETGPYVLAAHSSGGTYALNFANSYTSEVAGLVLLDSMSPYQYEKIPAWPAFYSGFRRVSALFPPLSRIGVGHLAYASDYSSLPSPARNEERAFWAGPSLQRSQRDEFSVLRTALKQAQSLKTVGDKPLYVLTAVKDAQTGWLPAQKTLTALSSNSVHELVPGADHGALVLDEKYAAFSNSAILSVVAAVRESKKLISKE
jgi:pimeloyl-ACP methyl ester carboxylesterase